MKRALLAAGILCLLLTLSFVPVARADTFQKVSVGGKPLTPIVDTTNGEVYVPDGTVGRPPSNVSVIDGTSVVGTVSMAFCPSDASSLSPCALQSELKPGTYDALTQTVSIPNVGNSAPSIGVISGTSVLGYPEMREASGVTPQYGNLGVDDTPLE